VPGIVTNRQRRSRPGADLSDLYDVVTKFERSAKAFGDLNPRAVGAACLVYKNAILRDVTKELGPDRRLSNWGNYNQRQQGGLKIGARYDVRGRTNAVGLVKGTPIGAWKVLEYGTAPHIIGLGKGGTARLLTYALSGGPNKRARGQLRRQQRKFNALFANVSQGSTSPRSGRYSHPIGRPIQHPGAKGKRIFTKATQGAENFAMTAYRNTIIREGFTAVWS